jgi:hypothetical protein
MTNIQVQVSEGPKPKQVVIRFNGHITWAGQSNGLPETIYAFLIVQDAEMVIVNKLIEDQSVAFVRSQAMYVQKEQGKIIDLRIHATERMLVPFHNISCITVDLINMDGLFSEPDEEGVERLPDGSEPLKN